MPARKIWSGPRCLRRPLYGTYDTVQWTNPFDPPQALAEAIMLARKPSTMNASLTDPYALPCGHDFPSGRLPILLHPSTISETCTIWLKYLKRRSIKWHLSREPRSGVGTNASVRGIVDDFGARPKVRRIIGTSRMDVVAGPMLLDISHTLRTVLPKVRCQRS